MQRIVLMMLLAVASTSAVADWILISGGAAADISAYADPATIRKTGNKAAMWTLTDYKAVRKTDGKMFMSVRSQNDYDCAEEKTRIFYANVHSRNMAGGEIISTSIKPREWEPIESGSVGEALWKIACGIRRQ